jgi:hypothetical protein
MLYVFSTFYEGSFPVQFSARYNEFVIEALIGIDERKGISFSTVTAFSPLPGGTSNLVSIF